MFRSFLLPRRRKTIYCIVFLLLVIVLFIRGFHHPRPFLFRERPTVPSVEYNFNNIPYRQLKNGSCALQKNGQWNCPDIRTEEHNTLRQMQLVMMRMLLMFDALAKKYNLSYWITRGTLLGAARHQGFIPWDSDLDIEMPIEDYLRFLHKGAEELPSDTFLQHHQKEKQFFHSDYTDSDILHINSHQKQKLLDILIVPWNPRFRDKKSCYKNCLKPKCSWHDGLQIDIYPIALQDGYYQDQFIRSKVKKAWRFIGWILGLNTDGYRAFPLRVLRFEGFDISVPNQWEKFLGNVYGRNYMDLPPKEKQQFYENQLPDPVHACSEFNEDGNLKPTLKNNS
ncbi:uncharacterized protein LOC116295854 [Actinia tenebrosa]|uniref:Uncharacterized protein LOC116295854 n=1 Tax=Actinia tenebrosa TaxID=6105 RepID=A0A6P8HWE0_ACTTE|nr:uncharacterized protein LOC116295854 [Actinia tenebrosa]